jgi:hypothetical protein
MADETIDVGLARLIFATTPIQGSLSLASFAVLQYRPIKLSEFSDS